MDFTWALATIASVGAIVAFAGLMGSRILLKQAELVSAEGTIPSSGSERRLVSSEIAPRRAAALDS